MVFPRRAPGPAAPRIDAHQHFWAYHGDPGAYAWMSGAYAGLRRSFGPSDLQPLLARADFSGTVAVQARNSVVENDYLLDMADRHAFILGVVGWLDLSDEKVGALAERYADRPKFKGIRVTLAGTGSDVEALKGLSTLAAHGLTLDILLGPDQIATATQLADRFSDLPIVIDHIAKPRIGATIDPSWRDDMTVLAQRPNISCKLSSLITQDDWSAWSAARMEPYLDHVLRVFGPERLMIGSDWPVCTVAADYATTLSVVIDWLAPLGADERDAILGGNCMTFYGLRPLENPPAPGATA